MVLTGAFKFIENKFKSSFDYQIWAQVVLNTDVYMPFSHGSKFKILAVFMSFE